MPLGSCETITCFLLGGFLLQMFGLEGVDPAVSAFLTSLYVAFTAIIAGFVNREWPGMVAVAGVIIVTATASALSRSLVIDMGFLRVEVRGSIGGSLRLLDPRFIDPQLKRNRRARGDRIVLTDFS